MRCTLEMKEGENQILETLTTIHGHDMTASVYQDGKYMIRHPDMAAGKAMDCTLYAEEVLACQR